MNSSSVEERKRKHVSCETLVLNKVKVADLAVSELDEVKGGGWSVLWYTEPHDGMDNDYDGQVDEPGEGRHCIYI